MPDNSFNLTHKKCRFGASALIFALLFSFFSLTLIIPLSTKTVTAFSYPDPEDFNPKIPGWEPMVRGAGLEQLGVIDKSEMVGLITSETVNIIWWENWTDPIHGDNGLGLTGARIGDLDNEGHAELYITMMGGENSDSKLIAFHAENGSHKWERQFPEGITGIQEPTLVDLDNDGVSEILVASEQYVYALEHDNTVLWTYDFTAGGATGVNTCYKVADTDGDGLPEIFFGTTGGQGVGRAHLLNGENGTAKWVVDPAGDRLRGAAVYDLNQDNEYELYIAEWYGGIYSLDPADGSTVWGELADYGGYHTGPSVGDVDTDGILEMVWSSWGSETSATVVTLDNNGTVEDTYTVNSVADDGVTLFDGDKDGDLEIYCDTRNDLYILNAADLTLENKINKDGAAASIIVCDIDNDNMYEIITSHQEGTGYVRAYSAEWPYGLEWQISLYVDGFHARDLSGISVGDTNTDGYLEIVVIDRAHVNPANGQSSGIYVIGGPQTSSDVWLRRAPIEFSPNTQENYTVKFVIPYDSDMQTDYDDLRFSEGDAGWNLTEDSFDIPYWLDRYNNDNATVYIFRAENSDNQIWMYYGNWSASSADNGEATFPLGFDDWEEYDIGVTPTNLTNLGDAGDTFTVETTYAAHGTKSLKLYDADGDASSQDLICSLDYSFSTNNLEVVIYALQHDSDDRLFVYVADDEENACRVARFKVSPTYLESLDDESWHQIGTWAVNNWYEFEFYDIDFAAHTFDAEIIGQDTYGGNAFATNIDNFKAVHFAQTAANDSEEYIDVIFIRRLVSPEPAATIGGEESAPTNIVPEVLNVYITNMADAPVSALDPIVQYKFLVEIRDNDKLSDVNEVWLRIFENTLDWFADDNARNHYTFKWVRAGAENWFEIGPDAVDENHIVKGSCSAGQDSLTTDNWVFVIKLGGVAIPTNWNVRADAIDGSASANEEFANHFSVNVYFSISFSTDNITLKGHAGDTDVAAEENPITVTISANVNFDFKEKISGPFTNEDENFYVDGDGAAPYAITLSTIYQTLYASVAWGGGIQKNEYYFIDIPEYAHGTYTVTLYTELVAT